MTNLTRRAAILTGAAAACAAALPTVAAIAVPDAPLSAEMFFTTDEPWGAFVYGHVTEQRYEAAVLDLLENDHDMREMAEEWLFEDRYDDDGELVARVIPGRPEHTYMRLDREDDPELGDVYVRCEATEPGAIPITAIMY